MDASTQKADQPVPLLQLLAGGDPPRSDDVRALPAEPQTLEADGLIDRKALDVVPPLVEYTLTPLGEEAASSVRLLADWIETNLSRILHVRRPRRKAA